jgi:hypothetical protein
MCCRRRASAASKKMAPKPEHWHYNQQRVPARPSHDPGTGSLMYDTLQVSNYELGRVFAFRSGKGFLFVNGKSWLAYPANELLRRHYASPGCSQEHVKWSSRCCSHVSGFMRLHTICNSGLELTYRNFPPHRYPSSPSTRWSSLIRLACSSDKERYI